ncbi:unnamed protein product [Ceutorhynchus assimilis]|uniref:Uncharacterized protein n=1 Tax=Ceutorhynchus assimilis TaxID=467358 RepID=A0A9N9MTI3_9CUCU|nr:unnamed protein product [Ceutorhynchus assimilis]
MGSAGLVRWYLACLSGTLLLIDAVIGGPVPERDERNMMVVPMGSIMPTSTRFIQVPVAAVNPPPQFFYNQYNPPSFKQQPQIQQPFVRGPFQFLGNWIQQTPWLPVEVNVPDVFQNIGNGINQATSNVQQFTQNVGNGVSQFTQNVGSGVSQFTQNVGNGFQQWMQQLGQRVPFIGNIVTTIGGTRVPAVPSSEQVLVMVPVNYPGGQQLVLEEALEAFP